MRIKTMKQVSEHAAAAKLIRTELKKHGIKGRVTAKSYAGGSSINVRLSDELPATASAIKEYCSRFEMGHFNGMEDIYEYSNTNADLPQVKFVFVENTHSPETRQAAWDWCRSYWDGMEDAPESHSEAFNFRIHDMWGDMLINRTLSEPRGFWSQHKPRRAAR